MENLSRCVDPDQPWTMTTLSVAFSLSQHPNRGYSQSSSLLFVENSTEWSREREEKREIRGGGGGSQQENRAR